MKKEKYNVAVVGATGAVGNVMLEVLEERNFPIGQLKLLASERSLGSRLSFQGREIPVEVLDADSFQDVDIALFSAGGSISERFAPLAAKAGAVVIDNTSAFRMHPEVPLVVPEVNPEAIAQYTKQRIIANPNCSTIQMVVVLKPIHDRAKIRRVVVSTYQATSGAGKRAMDELAEQTKALFRGEEIRKQKFPHQIAFNCLPHIDVFLDNGYTKEEMKMVSETKKIMGDETIQVTATCVRVPVFGGHSESVNLQTEKKISAREARALLEKAPGVVVKDDTAHNQYPLAVDVVNRDEVFVGRIRDDESAENSLNLWIVADNIRKGAATNAVQIAEILIKDHL
ncbi:MAG TPA: aspartate-semialdehyde dehydrogenase [Deltaproteobacteria bacterium]|nr:aspartate-semialdehyde dehydrogenase [Deltaproteobacteria bacterium]